MFFSYIVSPLTLALTRGLEAPSWRAWACLVASMCCACVSGVQYAFGHFSPDIKKNFNFTDTQAPYP